MIVDVAILFFFRSTNKKKQNDSFFVTLRSNLLSGIDPLLISCWTCLSHDLYTVVEKKTSISLSELLEQIHSKGKELREAAARHKAQFVDAGVPVAPCLTNLVTPILRENLPDKMTPRHHKRKSDEADGEEDLDDAPAASAKAGDAVGRATDEEVDDKRQPSQRSTDRKRWKRDVLEPLAEPEVAAAKAKAASAFARVRLFKKSRDRWASVKGNRAAQSIRPRHPRKKPSTSKSSAAKSQMSQASGSKGSKQSATE